MFRASRPELSDADRDLLEEACARNQSAELHFSVRGELRTARVRLLMVDDRTLRTDRPQCIGRETRLTDRTPVTVYFAHERTQYAFQSEVIRASTHVELNRRMRVPGMALRLPSEVCQQQRREDFRVSLARYEIKAGMHEVSSEDLNVAPVNAKRIEGRLTNISSGGVGVLCDTTQCEQFAQWATHFMLFSLPGVEEPFVMPAEVRHVRSVHEGLEWVIGLSFIQPNEPHIRVQLQRITRFIAEEQRQQLRSKSGCVTR